MFQADVIEAPQRAQHDEGLALLVFRRGLHLVARELKYDPAALLAGGKVQRFPIDRDLSAADAEESAKIDDGGTGLPGLIDDHVDDAAHILVGSAADLPAEDP